MTVTVIGKWSLKYVLLFSIIQLISLVLTIIGYPLIAVLAAFKLWTLVDLDLFDPPNRRWEWLGGKLTWLWSNNEDGIFGNGPNTRWQAFYWSAIRNSANNLRFVRGVSRAGRPLWHWTNGTYYAQAGWLGSHGQPVLSLGRGTGY